MTSCFLIDLDTATPGPVSSRGMRSLLRAAAVLSSLGLLIGCVWFAQKQAAPTAMPGSKSGILTIPERAQSSPPAPTPQMIMSGSKSFSGPMIKAEELQAPAGNSSPRP